MTQQTDPLGKVSTAWYDQADRIAGLPPVLGGMTFKYGPLNRGIQIFYDQAGNKELE